MEAVSCDGEEEPWGDRTFRHQRFRYLHRPYRDRPCPHLHLRAMEGSTARSDGALGNPLRVENSQSPGDLDCSHQMAKEFRSELGRGLNRGSDGTTSQAEVAPG